MESLGDSAPEAWWNGKVQRYLLCIILNTAPAQCLFHDIFFSFRRWSGDTISGRRCEQSSPQICGSPSFWGGEGRYVIRTPHILLAGTLHSHQRTCVMRAAICCSTDSFVWWHYVGGGGERCFVQCVEKDKKIICTPYACLESRADRFRGFEILTVSF